LTTQGYLSDGNSHKISISGSGGSDFFDVLRNKDILDLNGEADDDTFVVRSFIALEINEDGSTSNPDLGDLGIFGADGDDQVEVKGDFSTKQDDPDYVVNSLVDIDGGTGDDLLIVVGTEGDDSYVVADGNVYGGGLSIKFQAIERLAVSTAEGNDLVSILSTSPDFRTSIYGALGSDTFVACPREVEPVVSKNLRGHRGIIEHSISSDDERYDALLVEGVAVEVHDNDGLYGYVNVVEEDTTHVLFEDGTTSFAFWVYPTRRPTKGALNVTVISPATGDEGGTVYFHFNDAVTNTIELEFAEDDMSPQKVKVKYNMAAQRLKDTERNLMIAIDVVDLNTEADYFVKTEQSIQPVFVKLIPELLSDQAKSVAIVTPSDGECS
jgi:hypothetical protein